MAAPAPLATVARLSLEKPARPRVASPCISVCRLDPFEDRCVGCFRTLDEIATWPELSDDARRRVMDELLARRAKHKARPRGP